MLTMRRWAVCRAVLGKSNRLFSTQDFMVDPSRVSTLEKPLRAVIYSYAFERFLEDVDGPFRSSPQSSQSPSRQPLWRYRRSSIALPQNSSSVSQSPLVSVTYGSNQPGDTKDLTVTINIPGGSEISDEMSRKITKMVETAISLTPKPASARKSKKPRRKHSRILPHQPAPTDQPISSGNEASLLSSKTSKPLRILFCGSDDLSSESLRALYAEKEQNPDLIKSIDVVCRPGKPTGRSLKTIREVPIKGVAQELGLPVHEIDTFTGWDLPMPEGESINLIIAVSFGLLVPPRILKAAEYGGLNVHPSLLPEFRGPSPLQHTIMHARTTTAITVQTMHDSKFDHGKVLDRSPLIKIPNFNCTTAQLLDIIKPRAATLLVQSLRHGVFVPPIHELQTMLPRYGAEPIHAPKITSEQKRINWFSPSVKTYRQNLALGRLWSEVYLNNHEKKRLLFEDMTIVSLDRKFQPILSDDKEIQVEQAGSVSVAVPMETNDVSFFVAPSPEHSDHVPTCYVEDGDAILIQQIGKPRKPYLQVGSITEEGGSKKPASKVMRRFKGNDFWDILKKPGLGYTQALAIPKNGDLKNEGLTTDDPEEHQRNGDSSTSQEQVMSTNSDKSSTESSTNADATFAENSIETEPANERESSDDVNIVLEVSQVENQADALQENTGSEADAVIEESSVEIDTTVTSEEQINKERKA